MTPIQGSEKQIKTAGSYKYFQISQNFLSSLNLLPHFLTVQNQELTHT